MTAQFDNMTSFYNKQTNLVYLINISFDQIYILIYIHCYLDPTDF